MTQNLLYTIAQTRSATGLGRTKIYALIKAGLIDARKVGRRTMVPVNQLEAFVASLPKVAGADPHDVAGGRP